MAFRWATNGSTMELHLAGTVGVHDVTAFRQEILERISQTIHTVVADLSCLDHMDTTGMGALLTLRRHCRLQGGDVILRDIPVRVQRLFERARLLRSFRVADSSR